MRQSCSFCNNATEIDVYFMHPYQLSGGTEEVHAYMCAFCKNINPLKKSIVRKLNKEESLEGLSSNQHWGLCMLSRAAVVKLKYENVNNDRWLLVEWAKDSRDGWVDHLRFSLHPRNPLNPLDRGDKWNFSSFQYAATPEVQEWIKACNKERDAHRPSVSGTFDWDGLFRPWNSPRCFWGTLGNKYISSIDLVSPKKRSWWQNFKLKCLPNFIRVVEGEYPNQRVRWKRLPRYRSLEKHDK